MSYLFVSKVNTLQGEENEELILHYEERNYKLDLSREKFNYGSHETPITLLEIIEEKSKGKDVLSATAIGEILEEITELELDIDSDSKEKYTRKTLVTNFKEALNKLGGIEKYAKIIEINNQKSKNSTEDKNEVVIKKHYVPIAIIFMIEASTKNSYLYSLINEKRKDKISYECLTNFYFTVEKFAKKYYLEDEVSNIMLDVDKNIEFIFSSHRIQIKQFINHLWELMLELDYNGRMAMSSSIRDYIYQMYQDALDNDMIDFAVNRKLYKKITDINYDKEELTNQEEKLIEEMKTHKGLLMIEKEEKERCLSIFKK